jgi:hypothetical protein
MSFPLHILQAPRGQLMLAARARNDLAELARLNAEPLGELPEVYSPNKRRGVRQSNREDPISG